MDILFTGIRPTGKLHIGHYFSIIKPLLDNTIDHKYILIADIHALTELRKINSSIKMTDIKKQINNNIDYCIMELSKYLPLFDKSKFTVFKQSDLAKYHYDLFYKLMMVSKHVHTFGNPVFEDIMKYELLKEIQFIKIDQQIKDVLIEFIEENPEISYINIGVEKQKQLLKFFNSRNIKLNGSNLVKLARIINSRTGVIGFASYPMLMAADIILYTPKTVLVGSDQVPHLNITNDMIKILNNSFSTNIPQIEYQFTQTICGNDGNKMSKTYNNFINLDQFTQNDTDIGYFFKQFRTYPRKLNECGIPTKCAVGKYLNILNLCTTECTSGTIGCVQCKEYLCTNISNEILNNIKYEKMDGDKINQVLFSGNLVALERILSNTDIIDLIT